MIFSIKMDFERISENKSNSNGECGGWNEDLRFSCPACGQTCRPVYVHVHMYRVAGRNANACKVC